MMATMKRVQAKLVRMKAFTISMMMMMVTTTKGTSTPSYLKNITNNNSTLIIGANCNNGTPTKRIKPPLSSPALHPHYNHPSKPNKIFSPSYISWRNYTHSSPALLQKCKNSVPFDKRIPHIHPRIL